MTEDLLPWLRAQIAQAERIAGDLPADGVPVHDNLVLRMQFSDFQWPDRWNPVHVLAQCEAHTAILDRYERTAARTEVSASSYVRGQDDGYQQACWAAVLDVALAYQHNPGYQEAWRPDGTG